MGTLSASDFLFRSGNTIRPSSSWATTQSPTSISVRPIDGQPGRNRITIIWPDNAIQKTWLEVTLKATAATGLANDTVFYFGNAIGEMHNSTTDADVTAADALRIRSNQTAAASITNIYDIDRDGDVDLTDMQLATGNATAGASVLVLLDASRAGGTLPPITPPITPTAPGGVGPVKPGKSPMACVASRVEK